MPTLQTPLPETRPDLAAQGGECFRVLVDRGCDSKQLRYIVDGNIEYPHTDAYKARVNRHSNSVPKANLKLLRIC